MQTIAKEFKLYRGLLRMNALSALEYKGWWLMVLQVAFVSAMDIISTFLLFNRFGSVGEWSAPRIVLVYALGVTSFGLAESLMRGFDYFPWHMIRDGAFDRLLLRPKSLFTQVSGSVFHLHRLARVAVGILLITWSLQGQGIVLSFGGVLLLLSALLGGLLMYAGVFVLSSGIAIFTVRALDWIFILTNASYQVGRCPMPYMPAPLKHIFTFVMPLLVVSYYPASVLCGWGEPLWKGLLALPAGAAFLVVGMGIWRVGVRKYKSTGS